MKYFISSVFIVTMTRFVLLRSIRFLRGESQEIDQHKTYLHYEMTSLFNYAVKFLKLSESTAYALISIARKSVEVPELKAAIEEKKITVSNARRIAPILNTENKEMWIKKAAILTQSKLEVELAKSFPQRAAPTKVIHKSESLGRLEVDLPQAVLIKLKRAQEILSQKRQKNINAAEALEAALDELLSRHDPIEKAKRAALKQTKKVRVVVRPVEKQKEERIRETARLMGIPLPRKPIPAKETHQIILRDQWQCSHIHKDGSRCEAKQWLHFHHIKEVARGGSNDPSNLRMLCSAHHRMLHHPTG